MSSVGTINSGDIRKLSSAIGEVIDLNEQQTLYSTMATTSTSSSSNSSSSSSSSTMNRPYIPPGLLPDAVEPDAPTDEDKRLENVGREITKTFTHFQCPICYTDPMKSPMVSSCGHTICKSCVDDLTKAHINTCSCCRRTVNGYVPNFTLDKIINEMKTAISSSATDNIVSAYIAINNRLHTMQLERLLMAEERRRLVTATEMMQTQNRERQYILAKWDKYKEELAEHAKRNDFDDTTNTSTDDANNGWEDIPDMHADADADVDEE